MGKKKFESELHKLCEEAKWAEVAALLSSLIERGDEGFVEDSVAVDGDEYGIDDGKEGGIGGGGPSGNHKSKLRRRGGGIGPIDVSNRSLASGKRRMSKSNSVARTCTTTAPSSSDVLAHSGHGPQPTVSDASSSDASSSDANSFQEDLRCSYDNIGGLVGGGDEEDVVRRMVIDEYNGRVGTVPSTSASSHHRTSHQQPAPDIAPVAGLESAPVGWSTSGNGVKPTSPLNGGKSRDFANGTAGKLSPQRRSSLEKSLTSREGPNKWTPLMIACKRAPPEIISFLIDACPEACGIPDRSGSLPMHTVCCWRRSKIMDDVEGVEGRDIVVPSSFDRSNTSLGYHGGTRNRSPSRIMDRINELCLVIYMLMMSHPDSLATANRRRQTPLHSLFESKNAGGMGELSNGLRLVETLLGSWGSSQKQGGELYRLFESYTAATAAKTTANSNHGTTDKKIPLIRLAARRALRLRDSRGRLPLHCAAECPWADEFALRAMVLAFPAASYSPVLPPFSPRGCASSATSQSWDVHRSPVIQEESKGNGGDDGGGEDGLFPRTGGFHGRDLAVHLLHRRFVSPILPPPSVPFTSGGRLHEGGSLDEGYGEAWSRGSYATEDASVFLNEDHCAAVSALLEPLVDAASCPDGLEARLACAATGSLSLPGAPLTLLLPLHIASLHGVSHGILRGLCRAYPEGALAPMNTPLHYDRANTLPIELFEEGRSGHEVNAASDSEFVTLSVEYFRRSDLLFSYNPEAVSSKGAVYCRDEARLGRFERLIREEASTQDPSELLSDVAGSVWLFLCRSVGGPSSASKSGLGGSRLAPNFGASVGRILYGIEPRAVQRLNFVRMTSIPEGVLVPKLRNGRTVLEEAKERAPCGSMRHILDEHFFHSLVLSFLGAREALSCTATCRKAWMRGVRLLPRMMANNKKVDTGKKMMGAIDTHGSWKLLGEMCASETSSQYDGQLGKISMPWQKLELPYVPSCTHTVFISCDISYQNCRGSGGGREDEVDSAISCEGGGLLVLSEDAATDANQPDLVVASMPVGPSCLAEKGKSLHEEGEEAQQHQPQQHCPPPTTRIRFSYNHLSGRSYALWYYGSEGHILTVANLTIRQLVYSCDYNGHNPLHVLLCEDDNPRNLREQLDVLVAAGFGSNLPVHYAIKVGVLERTLRCLIDARPAALLDTDSERRTPLHAAFDGLRAPSVGVVRALLTSPGVNATHLKDTRGKLPIHLAAERGGAVEALLKVLVDAYADGCYRRTDDGDLPVHLLVRSGSATQATVELLLQPIIKNPTICAYPGSAGVNLPLHIAAEYCCKYGILEGLLTSYGQAAQVQRQIIQAEGQQKTNYALEIFEEGRRREELMKSALGEAEFNLRSDLIFVHNPNVPKSIRPYLTTYFRDEKDRIERLVTVIKREVLRCLKKSRQQSSVGVIRSRGEEEDEESKLADMAKLAWCWMCTNDHYAEVVSSIVHNLPNEAVRYLALVENPRSEPVADTPIKDCSAPRCALIIRSQLSFQGRYIMDRGSPPLHKSESCVILRAKDIGAMESYLTIKTLLTDADPDIDDYSHGCGSVYAITGNSIEVDRFAHFARKIGVGESQAIAEIEQLLLDSPTGSGNGDEHDKIKPNLKESGVKKSVFADFCSMHAVDSTGCQSVVIKFMKNKQCFDLERQCRDILREGGKSMWDPSCRHHDRVVPIFRDFSFEDSDGKSNGGSNDFTRDLYHGGAPSLDLSGFRYGIVMPCANGDLRDIFYREGISSSNLRENVRQVGETLQALHEQGISHMNLQLKNVLRFGKRMVLSDFGSALFLKSINGLNAIGGSSTKLCPSILPPEMIAKIDLSNRDSFDQLMRYWKYVHADANHLRSLTPYERQAISQFVESFHESKLSTPNCNNSNNAQQSWKGEISSLLETIRFEDLPHVLSKCTSLLEFCAIWERMCQNFALWEMVIRPRVDDQKQCVYMLKTFENRHDHPPRDNSTLPYKLVVPSEKVDVWIFGIFIYELCSGGNPFHTGYQGELRGVDAYAKLYGWDRSAAERTVREHVQDPLAQSLLCQVLVPADERLPTISAVLKHPFFSPKSLEAERYLERHEEMQLLRDNTVSVLKVTKTVTQMLGDSMEKYCKLAFSTDQIAFPTCLIVLPYSLDIDEINRPVAAANPRLISCAVRLGKCLLEINKATARLSFWLIMSGKMRGKESSEFKSQMQEWLKRARYESCYSIAMEIVNGLGCDSNYARVCEEVLAFDGNISQAKSYMRDPIRAARKAIKQNSDELSLLYSSLSFLYLVDETTLVPHCSSKRSQAALYPMQLEPNPKLIKNVLLPFMNIVAMKALAKNDLEGLASLLGLPPSLGIPESWRPSEPGLLHCAENSSSIEDFVVLQKVLRKDDLNALLDDASASSRTHMSQSYHSGTSSGHGDLSTLSISPLGSANIDLAPVDPAIAAVPMTQLELLFRERDPDREFGNLRRVTTGRGSNKSLGLWTNAETVRQLKSMVEMAQMEDQLRELKMNLDRSKDAEAQYSSLLSKRNVLKKNLPNNAVSPLKSRLSLLDNSFDNVADVSPEAESPKGSNQVEGDKYSRSPFMEQQQQQQQPEQQPQDEREALPNQLSEDRLEISTHRMPQPPQHDISSHMMSQTHRYGISTHTMPQTLRHDVPTHRMPQRPHHEISSRRISQQPHSPCMDSGHKDEGGEAGAKKKMRKSKRRFRPWFTAC